MSRLGEAMREPVGFQNRMDHRDKPGGAAGNLLSCGIAPPR